MELLEQSVFFGVVVSLAAYGAGSLLQKKYRSALLNPLLISVALTILLLVVCRVDYEVYYAGAKYFSPPPPSALPYRCMKSWNC